RYDLARHHRGADRATVTVLPPHVTHDGRAATDVGFRKRVVYLDTTLVPATLIGRSVDRSEITDPKLRHAIAGLHDSLSAGGAARRRGPGCTSRGRASRPPGQPDGRAGAGLPAGPSAPRLPH